MLCAVSIRPISQRSSSCLSHLSFDVRPDLPLTALHVILYPMQSQASQEDLERWICRRERRRRRHRKRKAATAKIPSASLPAARFLERFPTAREAQQYQIFFLPSFLLLFVHTQELYVNICMCIYIDTYIYVSYRNKSKERN